MMRKTITVALLTLSFALVAGCSSEVDCEGDDCGSFEPVATSSHRPLAVCTDQCEVFAGCDVMDIETCVAACRHDTFTRAEMDCLTAAACEGDSFATCFDNGDDDGTHRQ